MRANRAVPLLLLALLGAAPDAGPSFAQRWEEAKARHPALRPFQPLDLEPLPLAELQAWAPEDGGRATVYDRDCKPVKLARADEGLHGTAGEKVSIHGDTQRIEGEEVEYGVEVAYLGSGFTELTREADGGWRPTAGSAMGDLQVEPGVLASVDRDVARWTGARVGLQAMCDRYLEEVSTCAGRERVCSRCEEIGFAELSHTQGVGMSHAPALTVRVPATAPHCDAPCPPDPAQAELRALYDLFVNREFLVRDLVRDGPVLYRTRSACHAARARRR